MPQRVYLIETEHEVAAKHQGLEVGNKMGFSKGFQIATIIWIFVMVLTLFITINVNYNFPQLTEIRSKVSANLKSQIPQHTEVIDIIIPDGKK